MGEQQAVANADFEQPLRFECLDTCDRVCTPGLHVGQRDGLTVITAVPATEILPKGAIPGTVVVGVDSSTWRVSISELRSVEVLLSTT